MKHAPQRSSTDAGLLVIAWLTPGATSSRNPHPPHEVRAAAGDSAPRLRFASAALRLRSVLLAPSTGTRHRAVTHAARTM
jgi:hypothetical protein